MSGGGKEDIHREIERVARESYGRLVAYLSAHARDVAAAEDALSEALLTAIGSSIELYAQDARWVHQKCQDGGSVRTGFEHTSSENIQTGPSCISVGN